MAVGKRITSSATPAMRPPTPLAAFTANVSPEKNKAFAPNAEACSCSSVGVRHHRLRADRDADQGRPTAEGVCDQQHSDHQRVHCGEATPVRRASTGQSLSEDEDQEVGDGQRLLVEEAREQRR
jgi:hypothetical protein